MKQTAKNSSCSENPNAQSADKVQAKFADIAARLDVHKTGIIYLKELVTSAL